MQEAKAEIQHRLEGVKAFLASDAPPRLSESDTKANFIEPIIAALGWNGIGVVTREYYVKNSQEFIDYVMTGPNGLLLAIEAKPLHTPLNDKHAAQLIQYCAVEGIEWAALTNGRELQFFNSFLKPDLAAKRILHLDLLAFTSPEEFDALFRQLWQMSRESMTTPGGARTWLNQRRLDAALRATLLDPGSPAVRQLRSALTNAEIRATPQDVVQWLHRHLRPYAEAAPLPQRSPADGGKRTTGTSPEVAPGGAGDGMLRQPLLALLKQSVDQRVPATVWRETKSYIAAAANGGTYLGVRVQSNRLVVGLALPADADGHGLQKNTGQFNWPSITHVAFVNSEADVSSALLDHIVTAQEHAGLRPRTKTYHGITLRDLLDAGYLKPDTELILSGSGGQDIARARLLATGELEWEGHTYRSLSDKAFANLMSRQSLNGWSLWRTGPQEGSESLAGIRARMQRASGGIAPES